MSDDVPELTRTKAPPYYAVIFTSVRSLDDAAEYAAMANAMEELARAQPGCLGFDSSRGANRLGITVSYWQSLEAISAFRSNAEHLAAQRLGRERWYAAFRVRIAKVEREYGTDDRHEAP